MSHDHHHPVGSRVAVSIWLTVAFVAGEALAGYFGNSLALLSDAVHSFADAVALAITWLALRVARKPADAHRTFGSHRAGILAALANAVGLVVIALAIFREAVERFRTPEPTDSGLMIWVAIAAIALNGWISFWLHSAAWHDLNVRSAYLHMLGDAISAVGVVIAGLIIWATGNSIADPIVSMMIGVFVLWSSWSVITESVNILMEAAPTKLDMAALTSAIEQSEGVVGLHDLHVWSLGSGIVECSVHVVVTEQSVRSGQQVLRAVAERLRYEFGIAHTTIQIEVEGCELNEMCN